MSDVRIVATDLASANAVITDLQAEVKRLNRALDNMRAEYMTNLEQAEAEVKRLREENARLHVAFTEQREALKRLREAAELARIELDTALGLWERVPHDARLCVERARRTLDITAPMPKQANPNEVTDVMRALESDITALPPREVER